LRVLLRRSSKLSRKGMFPPSPTTSRRVAPIRILQLPKCRHHFHGGFLSSFWLGPPQVARVTYKSLSSFSLFFWSILLSFFVAHSLPIQAKAPSIEAANSELRVLNKLRPQTFVDSLSLNPRTETYPFVPRPFHNIPLCLDPSPSCA